MRIAIQAADLDSDRIGGLRVYLLNLLKYFGKLDADSQFLIYHKSNFNPELTPPVFPNYLIKKISMPIFWTQLRFGPEIFRDNPDVLWMPLHNVPLIRRRKMKVVSTIHDMAFKYFPDHFTKGDLRRLNFLTDIAIKNSNKIIAVSEATKKDVLKFYPDLDRSKIAVIYNGFDPEVFSEERDYRKEEEVKKRFSISGNYILHVGTLQPRKNLATLIQAFEQYRKKSGSDTKLVLIGEKGWLYAKILEKARRSPFKADIIMPGKLKFEDLGHLMRGASLYAYPSLYEGFGITILEAMASGVPVVCSNNSSLPEVGGNAVSYFSDNDCGDLAKKIEEVLSDDKLRQNLISAGRKQIKKFSWDKCAQETLECIKSSCGQL